MHEFIITALSVHLPPVLRWAGAQAKRLRGFDIGIEGKSSGSAATDALTLADLAVQELIVAALRDCDPIFRHCRIDAEESNGDLRWFPAESDLTLGIDPIDGTQRYRDRTDAAYSVMLHLRSKSAVLYSLVFHPEQGETGWWIEAQGDQIRSGPDDPSRPAADVVRGLAAAVQQAPPLVPQVYLTGFRSSNARARDLVGSLGIDAISHSSAGQTVYQLLARGILSGALIHSPNVYDFPVTMHLCQILGGETVWVHDRQPVSFHKIWRDERSRMLRLPGIVACSVNRALLDQLVDLARDWNPDRYGEHESF